MDLALQQLENVPIFIRISRARYCQPGIPLFYDISFGLTRTDDTYVKTNTAAAEYGSESLVQVPEIQVKASGDAPGEQIAIHNMHRG